MITYKNRNKILEFAKKYNIKEDTYITREMVRNARYEIGYSSTTTGTDIRITIKSFIRANNQ